MEWWCSCSCFTLLVSCVCLFQMRRGWPPFTGGGGRILGNIPIPSWKEQTALHCINCTAKPPELTSLAINAPPWQGWARGEPPGVRPHHGCGRTLSGSPWLWFRWEISFGLLEWTYVGFARSWDGLCWVLALFSSCSGPDLPGDSSFPWAWVEWYFSIVI
jgi:hypothetical protein